MKKITLLSTLAILATFSGPVSSFAATGSVGADEDNNYKSNGIVGFKPSDGTTDPTNPVDPVDPGNPVLPVDPTDPVGPGPGTKGPLTIDFASSFDFGRENLISSEDQVYNALAQKYQRYVKDEATGEMVPEVDANGEKVLVDGPNYVQVTDNRGTAAGWTLSVQQDTELKTEDGKTLEGAVIHLTNGNVRTASSDVGVNANENGKVDLTVGAAKPIMNAPKDHGANTYLLDWGTDAASGATSVQLSVPGKSTKLAKEYSTTLTWTISEAPGA